MAKEFTENQSKFFVPNKALQWKDWIISEHIQGVSASKIHKKLLEEFPDAKDVGIGSVRNIVKKFSPKIKAKKIKALKRKENSYPWYDCTNPIIINKNKEIRSLVIETLSNKFELNCNDIIKALKVKGVDVVASHVALVLGQAILNNEIKPDLLKIDEDSNIPPTFNDLVVAKDFVDKLGGLEKAVSSLCAYRKFSK